MGPRLRKFVLVTHLTCSVGWIGAALAYIALGIGAVEHPDTDTVRGAWMAMDLIGWAVIVPLAAGTLISGVAISVGTPWGLFRHYWVLISLALTVLCTAVLLLHMPSVSATATMMREMSGGPDASGGDLFHPSLGLLVLLTIVVLNVYKPRGPTRYGWRKHQERLRQEQSATLDRI
jgi:hypothetical protein